MDIPSVQPADAQAVPVGKAPAMGSMLATAMLPLLLALVLACAYFFAQNSALQSNVLSLNQTVSDLAQKNADTSAKNLLLSSSLSTAQDALSKANSQLADDSDKIVALGASVAQKDSQIAALQSNLSAEQDKRGQLMQDYQSLQADINASMAWFRDNSLFPVNYTWSSSIMSKRISEDCIDSGQLNLACVTYILTNVGSAIHYRTDTTANGTQSNRFQSLHETIDLGWGDCKDYSLLLKSLINLFKQNSPSVALVAWQNGGGQDFRIYPPVSKSAVNDKFWYYPDAQGVQVGTAGSVYPYVVCFNVDATSGHCVVALSQTQLLSSQDAPKLAGAQVFEPQNGGYLGTIGSEFSICPDGQCLHSLREIYLVIADSDLYENNGNSWVGYADYASRVSALAG